MKRVELSIKQAIDKIQTHLVLRGDISILFLHIGEKALLAILVYCGVQFYEPDFRPNRLLFLLIAGVVAGIYNGLFNDQIWRDVKDKKKEPKRLTSYSIPYISHTVFNHIVGGLVGAISLYLLLSSINMNDPQNTMERLGISEFILFLIATTGYFGLLPRTLWFGSYGPTLGGVK